jgi:hypothetical protein
MPSRIALTLVIIMALLLAGTLANKTCKRRYGMLSTARCDAWKTKKHDNCPKSSKCVLCSKYGTVSRKGVCVNVIVTGTSGRRLFDVDEDLWA